MEAPNLLEPRLPEDVFPVWCWIDDLFYRYECDPGERVFWGKLDSAWGGLKVVGGHFGGSQWLHADLKPGRTYFVKVLWWDYEEPATLERSRARNEASAARARGDEGLARAHEARARRFPWVAWGLWSEAPSTDEEVGWTPMKLLAYSEEQVEECRKLGCVNERGEVLWPLSASEHNKAMKTIEKRERKTPALRRDLDPVD